MIAKEARPKYFTDIIGHKNNVKTFIAKAKTLDFDYPDVMFMAGSTGTGKTTSALIIGATVNCHNLVEKDGNYQPCWNCPSCKSIMNETFSQDVHFFKSSEMEKQDIINLENLASTDPLYGGRKNVIIIDEAQNLAKSSKGATLNLLEKKRKNTIFILCTMDASAFDKATLSRGQVYNFKPLSASEVGEALIKQLEIIDPEEKIPIESEVLVLISQNSEGSVRLAEQYLERCIDSEIYTLQEAELEFQFVSEVKGYELFNLLINKDVKFYDKLQTVKSEAFYIYAWSILGNLNNSILTLSKDDWKYKNSKEILNSPNYKKLASTFLSINKDTNGWFKEHIFNYYIGEYMNEEIPTMTRVRQRRVD
jgi:DNA polymerase III subunit gamma/tau